jgi:hypothetical protein
MSEGEEMSSYFTTDPYDIETRFSNEDSFAFMEDLFSEPSEEDMETIFRVREILEFIPQWEADVMEMFFFLQMRQTDIAHVFRVSQPTVCYRLKRAAKRIHYLLTIVHVTEEEVERDFAALEPFDIAVVKNMYATTCQSEVATRIGSSQSMVRHRFLMVIDKIKAQYPELYAKYGKTLEMIRDNPNILRDVSRNTHEGKIQYRILPS